MFIDYVPLLLVNMVAGLVVLAWYVLADPPQDAGKHYAPPFGIAGSIALAMGAHLCWTWPLPGSYNVAFGELSVLLGGLFLGAAVATGAGWGMKGVAVYALAAAPMAVLTGVRIMELGLTKAPYVSGAGFVLTGGGGVLSALVLLGKARRWARLAAALPLIGAATLWAATATTAYWDHLARFTGWTPVLFQQTTP